MWKPTIRGLLARKVRLVLTALAVILGVAFTSATFVLTDTVKQSFDQLFAQTVSGVDLFVQGANSLGQGSSQRVPEGTLEEVRAVDGVARAEGFVTGYAQFVDRDGESVGGGGPPTFGVSWVDDGPFRLVADGESRAPRRDGEVAMDEATAVDQGFRVGDRVRVLLDGPAREFTIVGLFGFGDRSDFGAVTFAAFDLATAQQAFDARQAFDRIYVQRDPDVAVPVLRQRLARSLGPAYEVLTAEQAAQQDAEPVQDFLGFFTYALLGFAAIGVVVGAFVIFNTFTIRVTQRTRELGLLRAMGATGGQVIRSVVLEALLVGIVASVIGLVVGVVLGVGLLELMRGLGLKLPDTSTVLVARTVVVSLVVGVVVTVLASVLPALRASRVSPIAAINEQPSAVSGSMRRRIVAGTVVVALGVALVVLGLVRAESVSGVFEQVQVVGLGAFVVLVGVVMLLAVVARPVASVIGRPLRRLGPSGVLARENSMRNPRRTAITASALVIGLALVALTATFGASAKASVREGTGSGLRAEFVVKAGGFAGFSNEVANRLDGLRGVEVVVPMRITRAGIGDAVDTSSGTSGEVDTVAAADPADLARVVDLGFLEGGFEGLQRDVAGVLVDDVTARRNDLRVGDDVLMRFASGAVPLRVGGIYTNENFIGIFDQSLPIIVTPETYALGAGDRAQDTLVLVRAAAGQAQVAQVAMQRELARDFPNIDVLTRAQFRTEQQEQVDQFLTVLIAILALSELIAI
ncbi:MAG: ABC transporter permease, partial [Acidimicrobiia bacterium]